MPTVKTLKLQSNTFTYKRVETLNFPEIMQFFDLDSFLLFRITVMPPKYLMNNARKKQKRTKQLR